MHEPTAISVAFKEWAVVCGALATARQVIVLRKGGIDEGHDGFHVAHARFALWPTFAHQQSGGIVDEARPLLDEALAARPAIGVGRIELVASVSRVFEVADERSALALRDEHILSGDTVLQRFRYRRPGLFVLALRVARLPKAIEIVETTEMAGCRSWTPLPESIDTSGAVQVLDDAEFARRLRRVSAALFA